MATDELTRDHIMRWYSSLANLIAGHVPPCLPQDAAEWAALVVLAREERVAPLLARRLRDLPDVVVPAPALETLRQDYIIAVRQHLLLRSVRERLRQRLEKQSIPGVLLKGAHLAHTCYEDPITRPMSDLDLLVPWARREEAALSLEQDGFEPYSGSRATELRSYRGHLVYLNRTTQARVELHWTIKGLGPTHERAVTEIWAGAQPAGFEPWLQVMRLGHLLPHLAAHMLLQHRTSRLLWWYDLHRVLLATSVEEAIEARQAAERWRLAPCLAVAILSVHELFDTPIPEPLSVWATATANRRGRQARQAALPLVSRSLALPDGRLTNLLVNRDWSQLRALFPTPSVLRYRMGLRAEDSIVPAYTALLLHYLRRAPENCRRLWRYWMATPPTSSCTDGSSEQP